MRIRSSALLVGVMGVVLLSYAVVGVTYAMQQRQELSVNIILVPLLHRIGYSHDSIGKQNNPHDTDQQSR